MCFNNPSVPLNLHFPNPTGNPLLLLGERRHRVRDHIGVKRATPHKGKSMPNGFWRSRAHNRLRRRRRNNRRKDCLNLRSWVSDRLRRLGPQYIWCSNYGRRHLRENGVFPKVVHQTIWLRPQVRQWRKNLLKSLNLLLQFSIFVYYNRGVPLTPTNKVSLRIIAPIVFKFLVSHVELRGLRN